MLQDIHTSLQKLIFDRGRIPAAEVDVRFEMPTKEWVESLMRPTINLYLCGVEENTDLRQTNMQSSRNNGRAQFHMPPRRFDVQYMVSALSTAIEDEYLLLWRTLATLLKYDTLPAEVLTDRLRGVEVPLATRLLKADEGPRIFEIWGALELPPRPALLYVVTVPVDLEIAFESPLVLTRTTRFRRPSPQDEALGRGISPERALRIMDGTTIGGVVRSKEGRPLVGVAVRVEGSAAADSVTADDGTFVLQRVPVGTVTLHVAGGAGAPRVVTIEVPSDSYEITLD